MGSLLSTHSSLVIIFFICALALCAIFAFIETSITAIRLFTIDELERTVGSYTLFFSALRRENHRVLTTILVANSCMHVIATMLSAELSLRFFASLPSPLSVFMSILFTTSTMLVCGEIIPKNLAQAIGPQLIQSTLWISNAAYRLLYPLVTLLTYLSHRVVSHVAPQGHIPHDPKTDISVAEIRFLINHIQEQGKLTQEQAQLIQQVLSNEHTHLIPPPLTPHRPHRARSEPAQK